MKKLNIAVVGATGMVGRTFLKVLIEKKLPINNLYCFASERSAGKSIDVNGKSIKIILLSEKNIKNKKIDYALFSAGGKVSKKYADCFVDIGAIVIDNSSAFRMVDYVPLVVPQVNSKTITSNSRIIANPNCSTIQCMPPLFCLDKLWKIKKINYTTFQAVSGSGMKGINDLEITKNGKPPEFYPHRIFNNCLPHIGDFLDNGYSEEEIKMINETKKILNISNAEISATCVRVPIENSHSVQIDVEFEHEVDVVKAKNELSKFDGIVLTDNLEKNIYPFAELATGTDSIFVGRIRKDLFNKNCLHLFCVADNIRKGAASNAIEILECIEKDKRI